MSENALRQANDRTWEDRLQGYHVQVSGDGSPDEWYALVFHPNGDSGVCFRGATFAQARQQARTWVERNPLSAGG
jgi:hypothetical protein